MFRGGSVKKAGFTLVELMVVVAIIGILLAIISPALWAAKEDARRSTCAFNLRQMGIGVLSYIQDYDGNFPQTKLTYSAHPEIDDRAGGIETPDRGSPITHLGSFTTGVAECPSDPDPKGDSCVGVPNANWDTQSYLVNGYFVFGLNEYQIMRGDSQTVYLAERRSTRYKLFPPNCDVIFRPWFNANNPSAPWDDMDPLHGAIATRRHLGSSNYLFADNHCQALNFSQVWSPPENDFFTP